MGTISRILFLILILVIFSQCEKDSGLVPVPYKGLLAYYPFNNDADDETNNSHDGIVFGAEFRNDRLNNKNQSIFFDGIDDYVELDTMVSFNASLESFSVSFWLRADTTDVVGIETLIKTINSEPKGTLFSVEIHRGPSASLDIGVIRLDLRDNNDKYFTIYVHRPDIFNNSWHNISYIISSAKNNQGDVFIDGELESKDDYFVRYGSQSPEDFDKFDYNLTIGAGNNRGTVEAFFKGCLDEIAFYDRPLTTKEILQLYNR